MKLSYGIAIFASAACTARAAIIHLPNNNFDATRLATGSVGQVNITCATPDDCAIRKFKHACGGFHFSCVNSQVQDDLKGYPGQISVCGMGTSFNLVLISVRPARFLPDHRRNARAFHQTAEVDDEGRGN